MPRRRQLRAVPDQPRAVLYVRVSALMGRAVGSEQFHSPGMQIEAMRRSVDLAGCREVAVVEDLDRSGQNFTREGIDQIRAMVEAGDVDVVALYDLSRLGRNLAESLTFIRWLRDRGVSVMSSQERIDSSPEGQYMLGQFLGLAELYGAQIGRRWAQIAERRARSGKHHGVPPQGYLRVDGRLVVDPALGPVVTQLFAAYADGAYISELMRTFGAARGRPVRRNVLKWMLTNPVYRGRVVLHTQAGHIVDAAGEHPPLVDEATWERVARRMARDRKEPPRRLEPKYSLTGLIWCAHCEGSMQVWYSNEKGRVQRMVCSRRRQVGNCAGPGTPLYADLEAAVLAAVRAFGAELRGNPAARATEKARRARAGVDAVTLSRELAAVREAMGRVTQRWAKGGMPDSAYEKAMAGLAEQEELLAEQLGRAQDTADAPEPERVVGLVDDLMGLWPEMTEPERNRALRDVLVKVRVRRADRWREPVEDRLVGFEFR